MQHITHDDYVCGRGVRQSRSVGVGASVPALEHGVVHDVNESQAEVAAGPHRALTAPHYQRGDVVVVDVSLRAVPGLQPCLIHQVVTSDSGVLETEVENVADLDGPRPLGAVSGVPDLDYGAV